MSSPSTFAGFVRARREGLGLSLREFCRRNQLDPGNISRLEAGFPPPRSMEVLEELAGALKLVPNSNDWKTFLELAAVEDRLLKQVVVSRSARLRLPRQLRALRPHSLKTSADDLDRWANLISARSDFAKLLRRLIHSTADRVERVDFPAGEGSQRHGWDGQVFAKLSTAFVPAGLSAWEIGTGADPAKKANGDFRVRTADPLGMAPMEATFVFVTPRRWEGKGLWEQEKKGLGIWKDVRVYDRDDLEAWLELAPAVDRWFARLLGKQPMDTVDADEYWKNLSELTKPKLRPTVFLASREREADELNRWLDEGSPVLVEGSPVLVIEARAPAESVDFFVAYLAQLDEVKHDAIASRVLIVGRKEAWESLIDESNPLILVAKAGLPVDAEMVAQAVGKGHRVVLPSHHFGPGNAKRIVLPRQQIYDLERVLIESGFNEEEIRSKTRDCGGSLTVLKRSLARFPDISGPTWSQQDSHAKLLARLMLLGTWTDGSAGDRAAIERLIKRDYADVVEDVQNLATIPDPPVLHVMGRWSFTSREDAWILLARRLTNDQLNEWESIANDVVSDDDPQFDDSSSRRQWIKNTGDTPKFSPALHGGIAETLALLATRGDDVGTRNACQKGRVDQIVSRALNNSNWKRWASLQSQLPTLAEAAPGSFLSAIENDLRQSRPAVVKLFEDDGDEFYSRFLHTGLLWALETLAWDASMLTRVGLILAELAERLPVIRSGNRPDNSLHEIFLPWLPQTTANVSERLKSLRKIAKKHPDAGWNLLKGLLAETYGVSMPTHKPAWRDWTASWSKGVSNADYWKQIDGCGDLLLEMAGAGTDRWVPLIECVANLPKKHRSELAERLFELDREHLTTDDRMSITYALRTQIAWHKGHSASEWALSSDEIERLDRARSHFEPDDPVARHCWLFGRGPELFRSLGEATSFDDIDKRLGETRRKALAAILDKMGMNGIRRLAMAVKDPISVGYELKRAKLDVDETSILPVLLTDPSQALAALAHGYVCASFEEGQWVWIESLSVASWSPEQVAMLFLGVPKNRRAWAIVETHSDAACRCYWTTVSYPNVQDEDTEHAVTMLLDHSRPLMALSLLAHEVYRGKRTVDPRLVVRVLEAGLSPSAESNEESCSGIGGDYQELFKYLQSGKVKVDEERLAKLEWAYLAVLDSNHSGPETLHRSISREPAFFAEILKLLYRSKDESESAADEASDEAKKRATNAFKLLHSWKLIPGLDEKTDRIDEGALFNWVNRARELCQESGRLEICDIQIGELLAHAPSESDGDWPCEPVKDLLEDIQSKELVDGFVVGTLNKRGVVVKSPFDGGEQERAQARKFIEYASKCDAEWPTTARALRQIAEHYEDNARREDDEAEARRIGR